MATVAAPQGTLITTPSSARSSPPSVGRLTLASERDRPSNSFSSLSLPFHSPNRGRLAPTFPFYDDAGEDDDVVVVVVFSLACPDDDEEEEERAVRRPGRRPRIWPVWLHSEASLAAAAANPFLGWLVGHEQSAFA